ncbi:MAG: DUF134 domain-containing protein [Desulfobulbus sp.]|nr:DUF134 domain-containing protein [Desulfobulbus sp.]
MPRPIKGRNVCCLPRSTRFGPLGNGAGAQEEIQMTVDEYEAIRLIDHMNFTQEECAAEMKVARTTVQAIYERARKKLASSLVDCIPLTISGGSYQLYGGRWGDPACHRGACGRHRRGKNAPMSSLEPSEEDTP